MSFITIIVALGCLAVGCIIGYATFRYIIDKQYKESMAKAERDTEVLKEKKLLEVKEKFLNKKSELEKEVQQRNHKFQQNENRLKQKEITLNQRLDEINRRKQEIEQQQQRVDNEKKLLMVKEQELEKTKRVRACKT